MQYCTDGIYKTQKSVEFTDEIILIVSFSNEFFVGKNIQDDLLLATKRLNLLKGEKRIIEWEERL